MTRCCSHCSHNGHNSRTCPNRGVKIFGVRLTDGLIRKSASMGNLSQYSGSNSGAHNGNGSGSPGEAPDHTDGYASENFVPGSSSSREMKKRVPWTEEEHRMFLFGLQKLGKGDWRDTPMVSSQDMFPANHPELESSQPFYPVVYPTYFPPFFPYSFPYWMGYNTEPTKDTHEVVKPMAVHSKSSINVDELVGMSKLSLGETIGDVGSSLSLKLDGSSRQSAFHANPASSSKSSMDSSGNPIHAV
ncbi:hypothetical protein F3Y22_tig00110937pilonHSYRG00119 [Hibiscus syriacus]|uniref:HTH myb-type domain-containing protein n=1 Tax=Hibiscus syriacus TaxID=106335 RepID=A0A6A2ZBX7_HIBSY|nr:hypothetical protein F3Y22_tig00110937pilonHSYRG00119 [Hibiscus syriacus]